MGHNYFRISRLAGRSLDDCALLLLVSPDTDMRYDEDTDWLLVRRAAGAMRVVAGGSRKPKDLWMSPAGHLYLVGARDGRYGLHRGIEAGGEYQWSRISDLDMAGRTRPYGVWGLSDDLVFAWGGGRLDDAQKDAPLT